MASIRKLEEEATKGGKEVESQGKKVIEFFIGLKREAIGFVAAFYGGRGIADIVGHLTHLDASAARLARTVNASSQEIAKWRIAMQSIGGSAEDADAAIGGLSDTWQDFLRNPGNPPAGLLAAFKQIGLRPEDYDKPIKALEALSRYGRTPGVSGAQFGAVAREFPGMNERMINLLLELDKRLPAAEKVTPAGDGVGTFSEEFIASMTLFDTAANNVARVLLNYFIPAINSLTTLLTKWLAPSGSPEAKKIETDLEKHVHDRFGTPPAWLSRVFGLEPQGPVKKLVPRGDTGIGILSGATGYSIEEGGVVIASGSLTGAKGAAAASSVNNRTTRNSTVSTVNVGTINANLPGVTDAGGFARGLPGAVPYLNSPFGSSSVNSAY
jgi:hypothetical protein